jgi:hypothetical protein
MAMACEVVCGAHEQTKHSGKPNAKHQVTVCLCGPLGEERRDMHTSVGKEDTPNAFCDYNQHRYI